jgi:DNA-binding beta-propeller fold protein YncE
MGGAVRGAGRVMAVVAVAMSARAATVPQSFVNFESGHVRPLSIHNGLLFAVDTPDNRLDVFIINGLPPAAGGAPSIRLKLAAEISVGLEPVAVASSSPLCQTNADCPFEVWVVNHLSDDLTAIRLTFHPQAKTVTVTGVETIPTCDEPRDIVLAGQHSSTEQPPRAFVTAARRGQQCPVDAKLRDEGLPRGLVQVFAVQTRAPIGTLELFSDTPRGLAASRDGKRVYAAGFLSGNQTAVVAEDAVASNGGLPPPLAMSTANPPPTSLVVRFNPANGRWEEDGLRPPAMTPKDWTSFIPFTLPDYDVFAIDALATPPSVERRISGVGTVLFNLAVRPTSTISPPPAQRRDQLFVTNTEALNVRRFEPTLRGEIATNRVTVITGSSPGAAPPGSGPFGGWSFAVQPVHLNSHVDYTCKPPLCAPAQAEIDKSLAQPTDLVFSPDGKRLYVAALGSGAVGIFDAGQLSLGNADGRTVLPVGGGPSGVALDAAQDRLYVMDRFNNRIVVVRNAGTSPTVLGTVSLYDPSGDAVRTGRRFLYDAHATSAHGDASCATCHVFGDFDALAWDLGNPFGPTEPNCNQFAFFSGMAFHPMKGPMTTQTLRGMANAGPLHWRGDRSGCGSQPNVPPDQGQFNVAAAFKKFNGAFVSLLGRGAELDATPGGDLDQFTDFALGIRYPPNPVRPLAKFSDAAEAGQSFYTGISVDVGKTCDNCHAVPLGTNALSSFDAEPQVFKIPHMRNLYQKVGMFGVASGQVFGFPATGPTGDQVRGVGYLHDGSVDTLHTFLSTSIFTFPTSTDRDNVEQFLLEFDTGMAPAVGQQVTSTFAKPTDPSALIARADAGDCDLVARGVPDPASPRERGYWYRPARGATAAAFRPDTGSTTVTPAALQLALKSGGWLTYTCVPPGSGRRIGIDRDCDGIGDGDETVSTPDPIAAYPTGACP